MSITCNDARDAYSALLDGEVDLEYREVLEGHLSQCSDCLRALAKLKHVSDLYRDLPKVETDYDFEAALRERRTPSADRIVSVNHAWPMYVGIAILAAAALALAWNWLQ